MLRFLEEQRTAVFGSSPKRSEPCFIWEKYSANERQASTKEDTPASVHISVSSVASNPAAVSSSSRPLRRLRRKTSVGSSSAKGGELQESPSSNPIVQSQSSLQRDLKSLQSKTGAPRLVRRFAFDEIASLAESEVNAPVNRSKSELLSRDLKASRTDFLRHRNLRGRSAWEAQEHLPESSTGRASGQSNSMERDLLPNSGREALVQSELFPQSENRQNDSTKLSSGSSSLSIPPRSPVGPHPPQTLKRLRRIDATCCTPLVIDKAENPSESARKEPHDVDHDLTAPSLKHDKHAVNAECQPHLRTSVGSSKSVELMLATEDIEITSTRSGTKTAERSHMQDFALQSKESGHYVMGCHVMKMMDQIAKVGAPPRAKAPTLVSKSLSEKQRVALETCTQYENDSVRKDTSSATPLAEEAHDPYLHHRAASKKALRRTLSISSTSSSSSSSSSSMSSSLSPSASPKIPKRARIAQDNGQMTDVDSMCGSSGLPADATKSSSSGSERSDGGDAALERAKEQTACKIAAQQETSQRGSASSIPRKMISRYQPRQWKKDANELAQRRQEFCVSHRELEDEGSEVGGLFGVLQELEALGELVENSAQDATPSVNEPQSRQAKDMQPRPGALRSRKPPVVRCG